MIRQALTTLFCAALFTLILAIPVRALDSEFTTIYVCTTEEAALATVAFIELGQQQARNDAAMHDEAFECWFIPSGIPFKPLEILSGIRYVEDSDTKAIMLAEAPDGTIVWTFGEINFLLYLLHSRDA